jgi:cytochrome P450 family 6
LAIYLSAVIKDQSVCFEILSAEMELFSVTSFLFAVLSIFIVRSYFKLTYWKRRGVPHATPILFSPETRGLGKTLTASKFQQTIYDKFKGEPVCGMTIFGSPVLMIRDLDLVKNIFIKDFNSFPNRNQYYNEKDDPLTAHLVNLEGEQWRNLRTKLTPTFTSGKIKSMLPTITGLADNLINVIKEKIVSNDSVEIKEMLSRFTVDVIGTVAFGLECNR